MFNINSGYLNIICFLCFVAIFMHINVAMSQNPTLLSSSKTEEKIENNWILPQILNGNYTYLTKEQDEPISLDEIKKYVLPPEAEIGNIILDESDNTPPLAEIIVNDKIEGYLFETHDWVQGLGYSRSPYHIIVGLDLNGIITGARITWHTEPIAILGRTDQDLHDFVQQLGGVNIKQGINIVLGLSDSVLEGDTVSMRATAGDTSDLYDVDGISRTTTTSLLLNDAVMRAARKVARNRNISIASNDLGVILNLEHYTKKNWQELIEEGSIAEEIIINGVIANKFEFLDDIKAPRKVRLSNDEEIYTKYYAAVVSPEGIGANILGRRWYDQYVVTGRNVEDLVVWVGFSGPGSFLDKLKKYDPNMPFKTLKILQHNKEYLLKPFMYKDMPFHHAKNGPELVEQGLFYFSKDERFDPTKSFDLVYTILGDKQSEFSENNSVKFALKYQIPEEYINKLQVSIQDTYEDNDFDWKRNWLNNIEVVILSVCTVFLASFILAFKDIIVKRRFLHSLVRTSFLIWVLVWLGWIAGGQISIIHLTAFMQALYDGRGFTSFLAEPAIVIIGLAALVSMPIWGRALFCGWLCPFGALQELLNKFAVFLGIKQKRLGSKLDLNLKYGKYMVLFIIGVAFIYSFDMGLKASAIEPFKTAITFRFNAPIFALIWVLILITSGIFIERAYCRFLCPLGAAFALIGKVRLFNFLHRRKECGNPCKACNPTCPTQAIKFNGKIDMNECFQCLDCQVMYFDNKKCPPLVANNKKA